MFSININSDVECLDKSKTIINRIAIRCVAFKDGKLLLIRTNKGDLKFPGGGVEESESHIETLAREILEETGYMLKAIGDVLGDTYEARVMQNEKDRILAMRSVYYFCEIDFNNKLEQKLDDYEKQFGFEVVFATINEALEVNENILLGDKENINIWVNREAEVLKELTKMNIIKD